MTIQPALAPRELDEPLEVDPADWSKPDVYQLITSLVVPRPIAWISTVSPAGRRNLAPYSYFSLVADHPPHVAFSSIGEKDTLRNIRATGQFVVNLADQGLLEKLDNSGAHFGPDQDEFLEVGVTPVPSVRVRPPRVREAKAHMECEVAGIHPVGNGNLVLGRVVHVHVEPSVWRNGRVDSTLMDPVLRLSRCYGRLSPEVTAEEEPAPHVFT
ncbi:flavin reductase family protein [Polymorphospora sp. NPDC050346]|uniref:flavin reductase family protein n=1 Tax=Polymorphospora sp. NPDC050346 TaxID=3155780 RepID=UPI0033C5CBCF